MARIIKGTGAFNDVSYAINMDQVMYMYPEVIINADGTRGESYTFIQLTDERWLKVKETVDDLLDKI